MTATKEFTYTVTRTVAAPVATAWQAWTVPDRYEKWAAVAGSAEMDVRPGGRWKAAVAGPDGDFPLTGRYLEVTENEVLVIGMDIPGQDALVMTVYFEAHGATTQVAVTQGFDTAHDRDISEQGTTVLLDALVAYLATSR